MAGRTGADRAAAGAVRAVHGVRYVKDEHRGLEKRRVEGGRQTRCRRPRQRDRGRFAVEVQQIFIVFQAFSTRNTRQFRTWGAD